jgi:hypothetical protein
MCRNSAPRLPRDHAPSCCCIVSKPERRSLRNDRREYGRLQEETGEGVGKSAHAAECCRLKEWANCGGGREPKYRHVTAEGELFAKVSRPVLGFSRIPYKCYLACPLRSLNWLYRLWKSLWTRFLSLRQDLCASDIRLTSQIARRTTSGHVMEQFLKWPPCTDQSDQV